ncbi:hypothetical protein PVW47_05255 [Marinovum sp. SP66]|uniref:hypothetical protein n=1 Tax=Marinovum sp. SP66 TaxID=3028379 RepID=UPI00237C3399|nr:hypothetical protein [Marinovum sp. SP66]MDD9739189.1 hypothetical protein [Marinovum sp. SP66]
MVVSRVRRVLFGVVLVIAALSTHPAAARADQNAWAKDDPSAVSNIIRRCHAMKSIAAWARDWQCSEATVFDDGNDRKLVNDLRRKEKRDEVLGSGFITNR